MSLKDLEEHGILLPEEEWGVHDLHTSVNEVELVASFVFGALSAAVMYFGAGGTFTFVGGVMFIGFLAWITHISIKATDMQAAQFAEEHDQFLEEHPDMEEDEAGGMFESREEPGEGHS